jgi:hypothetical protein
VTIDGERGDDLTRGAIGLMIARIRNDRTGWWELAGPYAKNPDDFSSLAEAVCDLAFHFAAASITATATLRAALGHDHARRAHASQVAHLGPEGVRVEVLNTLQSLSLKSDWLGDGYIER